MFNYKLKSKDSLIRRIKELEASIVLLEKLNQKEDLISYPFVENLGHWLFMLESNQVLFNKKKAVSLGYEEDELPLAVGFEFFMDKIHPEDYIAVINNMKRHLLNETDRYEIEYRIQNKTGTYVWHYDRGTVSKRDEDGNAIIIAGVAFDITEKKQREIEMKKTNEKLKVLVNTDVLTPAFNKRYLTKALKVLIDTHTVESKPFSLVMLDIDDFKILNDTLGHSVGDDVLKSVVKAAIHSLKPNDIIARWGGDEFMILLVETDLIKAIEISKQILSAINDIHFEEVKTVEASVGVHAYHIGDDILKTINTVDQMVYQSKQKNKNGIQYEFALL